MSLIDTHCHLDLKVFDSDREALVGRCREQGLSGFILPGVSQAGWDRLLTVGSGLDMCYVAPGLHPCFTEVHETWHLDELRSLMENRSDDIVAIGEVGLDFLDKSADRERQHYYFRGQVDIAAGHALPLILHVRKAHDEVLKVVRGSDHRSGGIVHCYSGSLQQAERYVKIGFKLGIGGVITYSNARRLQNIVRSLPLASFVLETDAPDIPPAGFQGDINTPENLPTIFESFCRFREEPRDAVEQALYHNTVTLFPRLEV